MGRVCGKIECVSRALGIIVIAAAQACAPESASDPDMPIASTECPPGELPNLEAGAGCCAIGERGLADGICVPAGVVVGDGCPPGEHLNAAAGMGCCAAGTLGSIDGSCRPAGILSEDCAPGMKWDVSAGCVPVLPAARCPRGQMATLGETTCRDVAPCGDAPWGNIVVAAATQYVDASYAGGESDGSALKPWTTIQTAVDTVVPNGMVAVAAGIYDEEVWIEDKPVTLWGRCPALVEIAPSAPLNAAVNVVLAGASGSVVRGIAASGADRGIAIYDVADVAVQQIWAHDTPSSGVEGLRASAIRVSDSLFEVIDAPAVLASSSDISVSSTMIREARFGVYGYLVSGDRPSTVSVLDSVVEQTLSGAVQGVDSDVRVEDSFIGDRFSNGNADIGVSVSIDIASATPRLDLSRSVVSGNVSAGVFLAAADASIDRTVIAQTRALPDGMWGEGIWARKGDAAVSVAVSRSLIADNRHNGIWASGAALDVATTVLRGTRGDTTNGGGGDLGASWDGWHVGERRRT